jgi:hypothetical protein
MQQISTRQRILIRAIVLVIILTVLAMFGLLRRAAIVHSVVKASTAEPLNP